MKIFAIFHDDSQGFYAFCTLPNTINWPFNVSKEIVREYATEDEIAAGFGVGIFPFCKTEAGAKMALVLAIMYHNETIQ